MFTRSLLACALVLAAIPAHAETLANCDSTSKGLVPLTELGSGTYLGSQGGLYPGGSNLPPVQHLADGMAFARGIEIAGRIVVISIGMSNTTQEFSRFVQLVASDPAWPAHVQVVDCAQGGQHAAIAADPNSAYWTTVMSRLQTAGVTPEEVRVAWVKEALPGPTLPFPQDAQQLQGYLRAIAQNLHDKFPHLTIAYFSSRIYAGYASTTLNPEPYAYQSGFAVKWLIEEQINGSAALNYDPNVGVVRSPWLGWGPYLWADGLTPRADGLTWACADFQSDGTHPSNAGRDKVAQKLLDFFHTEPTAVQWNHEPPVDTAAGPGAPRLAVWPNPMRESVALHAGAGAPIAIHDVAGRLVRVLPAGALPDWDRRDTSGARVGPGIYVVRSGLGAAKLTVLR
jgi:hypothetical protein